MNDTSGVVITGAKVKKQLNGTSVYVVFEGTEQAITDAYNTLYCANAVSGELEWLHNGLGVCAETVKQFKKGLFNREIFHLMDNPSACANGKHVKGGFAAQAKIQAEALWNQMELCRIIKPASETYVPYYFKVGDNSVSDSDMSGRD